MSTFLKLTTPNGAVNYFNMNQVEKLETDKSEGDYTLLVYSDGFFIKIKETPEEIMEMLKINRAKQG